MELDAPSLWMCGDRNVDDVVMEGTDGIDHLICCPSGKVDRC